MLQPVQVGRARADATDGHRTHPPRSPNEHGSPPPNALVESRLRVHFVVICGGRRWALCPSWPSVSIGVSAHFAPPLPCYPSPRGGCYVGRRWTISRPSRRPSRRRFATSSSTRSTRTSTSGRRRAPSPPIRCSSAPASSACSASPTIPRTAAAGLDYWWTAAYCEAMSEACPCNGIPMAMMVQTDMCTPALHDFASDDLKERFLRPSIEGKMVGAIGVTEPSAGSDVFSIRTHGRARRRLLRRQRPQDLHHQRHAGRLHHARSPRPTPSAGHHGFTLLVVPTDYAGLRRGEEAREDRQPLLRHRRARVRGRAGAGREPHRRGGLWASSTR